MTRLAINVALAWLLIANGTAMAQTPSRPIVETQDLREPIDEAIRIASSLRDRKVLLVFDIDNTLLTMPQFLGSDRWFNYHQGLINSGQDAEFSSIDQLIATQAYLFGLASMKPTQPDIPALLVSAQRAGVQVILLTARGAQLADSTIRELARNQVDWAPAVVCAFFLCSIDGKYDAEAVRRAFALIGNAEAAATARSIRLSDGILFSSGQNKGTMLQLLTAALQPERFSEVIFVDDGRKNVENVAASELGPTTAVYQYRRVPVAITPAEIKTARKQLQSIRAAVCGAMETALCPAAPPAPATARSTRRR